MSRFFILRFLCYLLILPFLACTSSPKTQQNPSRQNTTSNGLSEKDSLAIIYTQAIADYIKAVKSEYQLPLDTLFFGKRVNGQPDDFPDITLPSKIEQVSIQIISPELGKEKQAIKKSSVYINLIGWVNKEEADFIFVTFFDGFSHQFDYHISYKYNADKQLFEVSNTRFEHFLFKKK